MHSQSYGPKLIGAILLARHNLIAVVDDDLAILAYLEQLFSSFGFQTEVFESAEEFVSVAPILEPACLILDIQLGNISGLELIRALRAEGFAVPVIFIADSLDERHRRQATELDCVAFSKAVLRSTVD